MGSQEERRDSQLEPLDPVGSIGPGAAPYIYATVFTMEVAAYLPTLMSWRRYPFARTAANVMPRHQRDRDREWRCAELRFEIRSLLGHS